MTVAGVALTDAPPAFPGKVLPGAVVLHGGLVAEVQPGRSGPAPVEKLGGGQLILGAVDLGTDDPGRQAQPRAYARWPSRSAMPAHDAQRAAAGIATVLGAPCPDDAGFDDNRYLDALARLRDHGRVAPRPRADFARVRERGGVWAVRRVRHAGGSGS